MYDIKGVYDGEEEKLERKSTAVEVKRRGLVGEIERTEDAVRYKCLNCGIEEDIPRSVVEMFDALDDEGDISVAPRFDCEKCDGIMEPLNMLEFMELRVK